MTQDTWTAVDRYISETLVPTDPALTAALESSAAANLPPINVAPNQGKFLHLLARATSARNILEIGTLGGYSTIWLARALPPDGGRVTTLELDPKHAAVARANFARANLSHAIDLIEGHALDTLPALSSRAPFDLVFIDADKPTTADYFAAALKLSRPGTVIIVDNVIRKGAVADPASPDANVQGIRRLNALLAAEPRVSATSVQTVGSKGYDGFTLAYVLD